MAGIFNQEKLLPLRYMPIQIELELVSDAEEALITDEGVNSKHWSISNAHVKCDLLTLDSSVENECASILLSGKSLPLNFSSWSHTVQQTGG
eukprot:4053026-Heterocapsa_arctica.AAC.1